MSKDAAITRLDGLVKILSGNINSQTPVAGFNASLNFLEDKFRLNYEDLFYIVMKTVPTKLISDEVVFEISKKFSLQKLDPKSLIFDDCKIAYEAAVAKHPKIKPLKESSRTKKDLEKIAEDLYKKIILKINDRLTPEYKRPDAIRDLLFYAGTENINGEKGFACYNHENSFIVTYLITKKHLLNDNVEQLFSFLKKVTIADYSVLFAEIAAAEKFDLLQNLVKIYFEKSNFDFTKKNKNEYEFEFLSQAKELGKLLTIVRSEEKTDEEKYNAIHETQWNRSLAIYAQLYCEADFKLSEKYVGEFLAELNEVERESFLKSYNDNFLAKDSSQKRYSGEFFKAVQDENENLNDLIPAAPASKTWNSAMREKIRNLDGVQPSSKTKKSSIEELSSDKPKSKSVPI